MGALLQKFLGGGPLLQLDHVECCNDEVRSSSSSDSWHTHASGHVHTARAENAQTHEKVTIPHAPIPWASPAASLAGR